MTGEFPFLTLAYLDANPTGIPKPQLSPLKGTPEGRRLRDVEISAALDEQLTVQMERLSVKQEALNCTPQTGKKCTEAQLFNALPSTSQTSSTSTVVTGGVASSRQLGLGLGQSNWILCTSGDLRLTIAGNQLISPLGVAGPAQFLTTLGSLTPRTVTTVLSAARATPGRQGIFNAYVVYSGRTPYFYTDWPAVKRMLNEDKDLVFKGFFTLEHAEEAWYAASNLGVIVAIQNSTGRPIWSVTEGVKPAVYKSVHEAVKIGLGWGGGYLKGWHNEADAIGDWNDKARARPSRIVTTPDSAFFS
ncbi:hypothetical protein GGU11DRAFT_748273 [Lentinula aff. detonsa]|nr:hypothetical protein GGU11DRAFT_748273 [Lentinula aff. detonsa]